MNDWTDAELKRWAEPYAAAGDPVGAAVLRVLGEKEKLEAINDNLCARVHQQSDLLSRKAEAVT